MLGKIEGTRRRGRQRMRWLDGIMDTMDMSLSKVLEIVKEKGSLEGYRPWGLKESDTTEWLKNKWLKGPSLSLEVDGLRNRSNQLCLSNSGFRAVPSVACETIRD